MANIRHYIIRHFSEIFKRRSDPQKRLQVRSFSQFHCMDYTNIGIYVQIIKFVFNRFLNFCYYIPNFGGFMTQSLTHFGEHTVAFARLCFQGTNNYNLAKNKSRDFVWTLQRVGFAAGVFFAMQAVQPLVPVYAMLLLCNVVYYAFPAASLGLGVYLFYSGGLQLM